MKAHELFSAIEPEFARDIIGYFREESRDIYKTTLASLAIQRKLRPVFVQKKPVVAQIDWLAKTLKLRIAETVGEHLLQVWLLKGQKDLLIDFLDAMEIEHDEDGAVEDLPDEIDKDKLASALDVVLQKYEAPVVTLYLRVFQLQQPGGWPAIGDALENDSRLVLTGSKEAVASEAEKPAPDAAASKPE